MIQIFSDIEIEMSLQKMIDDKKSVFLISLYFFLSLNDDDDDVTEFTESAASAKSISISSDLSFVLVLSILSVLTALSVVFALSDLSDDEIFMLDVRKQKML